MKNLKEYLSLEDNQKRYETLTKLEKKYFNIMFPCYGVLYIQSKPGIGKSAIIKSISDKMGYYFIDKRLSQCDESDFQYPYLIEIEDIKVSDYAIPKWAYKSNQQKTIILFDEINRCSKFVRDASLQILLERSIGDTFKFNDNVLMVASGNLGDEDNTDVEEFDSALNNRLIHIKHDLKYKEWLTNFGYENLHYSISKFIESNPSYYYVKKNSNDVSFATPRSWTFLSEYICSIYGKDSSPKDFLKDITDISKSYIGPIAIEYIAFCENMTKINIFDIMNDYDDAIKKLKKYNRDQKSYLISMVQSLNFNDLDDSQIDNLSKFMKVLDDDERTATLLTIIDNIYDVECQNLYTFLSNFKDDIINYRDNHTK